MLINTVRLHTLTSEDKRAIGAAIFVMGKARIRVSNSVIDSKGGFGIWVKHGGRVHVDNTNFTSAGELLIGINCSILDNG